MLYKNNQFRFLTFGKKNLNSGDLFSLQSMQNIVCQKYTIAGQFHKEKIINAPEFHVELSDSVDGPAEYDFSNEFDL